MYRQVFELDNTALRMFCIDKDLYTCGDCDEYGKMFKLARTYHGETEILEKVATDIYKHSSKVELELCFDCDYEDEHTMISLLMSAIFRRCTYIEFIWEEE